MANPNQTDRDGDGIGIVCDTADDQDSDGIVDAEDNCPDVANPKQSDLDHDGIGLSCDDDTITDLARIQRYLDSERREMESRQRAIDFETKAMESRQRAIDFEAKAMESRERDKAAVISARQKEMRDRNLPGPIVGCETCHASALEDIRQIVGTGGDFSMNSHHVQGTVQSIDCLACHYTGTHKSGIVKLVDPDQSTNVIYEYDPANPALIAPFCSSCHDSDGALSGLGVKPFSDQIEVPDVGANHFGQTCTECHSQTSGFNGHIVAHGGGEVGTSCETCHINLQASHQATPGSGWVVVHADTDHDDAGWNGPKPYFDVQVDCVTCHTSDLRAIHANDCKTCHTTLNDTLENNWQGGCRQGGCHTVYHEDSTMAHWPWENAYNEAEVDCDLCHNPGINAVVQQNCLNCHATYGSGDHTPPTTSLNNQWNEPFGSESIQFVGSAYIDFSITDNGKVGIGRTFYKIDNGPESAAMNLFISNDNDGTHVLEYWSVDQSGNIESPRKSQTYTVIKDTTPPTTTSNAQASYSQGGKITLTASDNSTLGVKDTYFRINGGATQAGTIVNVPVKSGTFTYTMDFWSVDWSGNIETYKSVTFTVTGGTGTIRLVWGNSDTNPADIPTGSDWADWYIFKGGFNGPRVASGSGSAPNWSGVDNITVPVSTTPYFILIDWEWEGETDQSAFSNVYVTTPGQVIRLSY